MYTDSKAAIGAVNRGRMWDCSAGIRKNEYAISQRAVELCAARPALRMVRAVCTSRLGPVSLRHVRAHSGGSDFASVMNAVADHMANDVRVDWEGRSEALEYHINGESMYRMKIENVPVIGSYRKAILRCLRARDVCSWTGPTGGARAGGCQRRPSPAGTIAPSSIDPLLPEVAHSRRLIAACGARLLSLASVVSKCHDHRLSRFFTLAAAGWLPTERRLHVRNLTAGRGDMCKLCGCARETVRHVFVCTSACSRACQVAAVEAGLRVLSGAGVRVVHGPPPSTPGVCWRQVWFDLTGGTWMACDARMVRPQEQADATDGLGDVLGVLPSDSTLLLGRVSVSGGRWRARPLLDLHALQEALQIALVRGAFSSYTSRCRRMQCWWASPSAELFRGELARQKALSRRRARLKKEARERMEFEARRRDRVPMGGVYPNRVRREPMRLGTFLSVPTEEEEVRAYSERIVRAGAVELPWY